MKIRNISMNCNIRLKRSLDVYEATSGVIYINLNLKMKYN